MPARARIGVVLAGGDGRRLGGDKPHATIAGRTLIDRAVDIVAAAGLDPVIVAKPGFQPGDNRPVTTLVEPPTPVHPLTGIAHALHALGETVVTMPCDTPFLDPELLTALAAHDGGTAVIVADGVIQPLIGRHVPSSAAHLQAAAEAGLAVRAALADLAPAMLDADRIREGASGTCADVDTPLDLRRARERQRADS